jgi:hypothetical protein
MILLISGRVYWIKSVKKLFYRSFKLCVRVRHAFAGHETFNIHPTPHHTEEDPFPDQLKGMWFCLHKKFFQPNKDCSTVPVILGIGEEKGKLPGRLFDVYDKGKEKVRLNFGKKLFNTFHVISKSNQACDEDVKETLSDCDVP